MKILIVTGGTGGHIFPGIAFGREAAKAHDVVFVGGTLSMEERLVTAEGFRFLPIPVGKLLRRITLKNILNSVNFSKGIIRSLKIMRVEKPDVVLGFGGYVSAPVIIAAKLNGVPAALHEQNAIPGLTNKVLTGFVKKVFASFPGTEREFKGKGVYTGNPVREEIGALLKEEAKKALNISSGDKVLAVIGGSQGAAGLNKAVYEALGHFSAENLVVLWMTGEKEFLPYAEKIKGLKNKVRLSPFFSNMNEIYGAADLLVARAGATTVFEALKVCLPVILIPFPAAANNHQVFNARSLAVKGAAMMFEEKDLEGTTGKVLAAEIKKLLGDSSQLRENVKKIETGSGAKLMLAELIRMKGE